MDMDNSVVIVGELEVKDVREINGNGKNTVK